MAAAWARVGAAGEGELTRKALSHSKVRHEAGEATPQGAALASLQVRHKANTQKAKASAINADVFGGVAVPVKSHVAREPNELSRVQALIQNGGMAPRGQWRTICVCAINGWQVLKPFLFPLRGEVFVA